MLEELKKQLSLNKTIRFKVKIISRSRQNEIVGTLGQDILKIKIAAPAVDNKANSALIKFLSQIFDCTQSNIRIVSGITSPLKIIEIK